MKLKEIYDQIMSLNDYIPSKKVDGLFSALASKAIDPFDDEMLSKKECGCLQKICSHVEFEAEKFWAQEIIEGKKNLSEYPYYENYKNLTKLEWNGLTSCSDHSHHNVLFVGSGPLPMTAIILALNHNVKSTLIDNDALAVELSQDVIKSLDLQHMISVICAEGDSFEAYKDFNVIFVAVLAGTDTHRKEKIFTHIKKNGGEHYHLIARSSWGKRRLLYLPLPQKVYKLFSPVMEISPYNVVNSIVIFKNTL